MGDSGDEALGDGARREEGRSGPAPVQGFRCDFCGREVPRVRRIALDQGYDRLQTPHRVQYACPDCSEAKERARRTRASG